MPPLQKAKRPASCCVLSSSQIPQSILSPFKSYQEILYRRSRWVWITKDFGGRFEGSLCRATTMRFPEAYDILLHAKTDTSAGTKEWAMSNLLNHPQIIKKALTEIHNCLGQDRLIDESDLVELPYLHCIINETMWMHPPGPLLLPHKSSVDCTAGGFRIPRGTILLVNVWQCTMTPRFGWKLSKFKPERFEELEESRDGFKLMPFGSRRRGVLGKSWPCAWLGWPWVSDSVFRLGKG